MIFKYYCFQKRNRIMAYRRPPSNVESMVSLRVDNLPYRAHGEVKKKELFTQLYGWLLLSLGFEASLWQIWWGWRYLSSNGERNWQVSRIRVREILRQKRRGGSLMGRRRDGLKCETDFLENGSCQLTNRASEHKLGKCWGVEVDGVSFEICHHPSTIYYEHKHWTELDLSPLARQPLTSRIAASDYLSSWVGIWRLSSDLSTWERESVWYCYCDQCR